MTTQNTSPNARFFLLIGTQATGPFDTVQILEKLKVGEISWETKATPVGGKTWSQLLKIPDFDHARTKPVTPVSPVPNPIPKLSAPHLALPVAISQKQGDLSFSEQVKDINSVITQTPLKSRIFGSNLISEIRNRLMTELRKIVSLTITQTYRFINFAKNRLAAKSSLAKEDFAEPLFPEKLTDNFRIMVGFSFVAVMLWIGLNMICLIFSPAKTNSRNLEELGAEVPFSAKSAPVPSKTNSKNIEELKAEFPFSAKSAPVPAKTNSMNLEELAKNVITVNSRKFMGRGLNWLEVGKTRGELAESLKNNPLPKNEPSPMLVFFDDTLIGFKKQYSGNNANYIEKIKDLFGGADEKNIVRTAGSSNVLSVIRSYRSVSARYFFPNVVVYANTFLNQDSRSPNIVENVFIEMWDRPWLEERLGHQARHTEQVLSWVKEKITQDSKKVDFRQELKFPGMEWKYKLDKVGNKDYEDQVKLLNGKSEGFIIKKMLVNSSSNRFMAGDIFIDVALSKVPSTLPRVNENTDNRTYWVDLHECNLLATQIVFPPSDNKINAKNSANHSIPDYFWRTSDGWNIQVNRNGIIYLNNKSEKGL